jgi:hypothetical protein
MEAASLPKQPPRSSLRSLQRVSDADERVAFLGEYGLIVLGVARIAGADYPNDCAADFLGIHVEVEQYARGDASFSSKRPSRMCSCRRSCCPGQYEVFLLSRVREEYLAHGRTSEAVAHGLARTARVITAAAAITVCVFLAFLVADDAFLKLLGIGMATAILVDATILRMVLVPAVMQLLGRGTWWLPDWLDQMLPRVDAEPAGARRVEAEG